MATKNKQKQKALAERLRSAWLDDALNEPRWPEVLSWLVRSRLTWAVEAALCRLLGHRLEDDGHAGPESGCIDLQCRRCGWSPGRTWLY